MATGQPTLSGRRVGVGNMAIGPYTQARSMQAKNAEYMRQQEAEAIEKQRKAALDTMVQLETMKRLREESEMKAKVFKMEEDKANRIQKGLAKYGYGSGVEFEIEKSVAEEMRRMDADKAREQDLATRAEDRDLDRQLREEQKKAEEERKVAEKTALRLHQEEILEMRKQTAAYQQDISERGWAGVRQRQATAKEKAEGALREQRGAREYASQNIPKEDERKAFMLSVQGGVPLKDAIEAREKRLAKIEEQQANAELADLLQSGGAPSGVVAMIRKYGSKAPNAILKIAAGIVERVKEPRAVVATDGDMRRAGEMIMGSYSLDTPTPEQQKQITDKAMELAYARHGKTPPKPEVPPEFNPGEEPPTAADDPQIDPEVLAKTSMSVWDEKVMPDIGKNTGVSGKMMFDAMPVIRDIGYQLNGNEVQAIVRAIASKAPNSATSIQKTAETPDITKLDAFVDRLRMDPGGVVAAWKANDPTITDDFAGKMLVWARDMANTQRTNLLGNLQGFTNEWYRAVEAADEGKAAIMLSELRDPDSPRSQAKLMKTLVALMSRGMTAQPNEFAEIDALEARQHAPTADPTAAPQTRTAMAAMRERAIRNARQIVIDIVDRLQKKATSAAEQRQYEREAIGAWGH